MTSITNTALIISYCLGLGPVQVEYNLAASNVVQGVRAEIPFQDDPVLNTSIVSNYIHSGYDRGHLAPAADFVNDRSTLESTYLMSNISPMFPKFNRGIWAQIEKSARQEVRDRGEATIVTIPVYGQTTNRCGSLVVPTAFVKLVYTNHVCVAAWCAENLNRSVKQ